jgi:hypothetical protein
MVENSAQRPPIANRAARWLSVPFSALFALSAAVQLNDPDWLPWFVFYAAATATVLAAPRWERGWVPMCALCGITLAWAAVIGSSGLEPITWGELTGDLRMKTLNVERHREIGGLGLSLLLLSTVGLLAKAGARTSAIAPAPGEPLA